MLITRSTYLLVAIFVVLVAPAFGQVETDQVKLANEYYAKGEVEKAKVIYEEISKDPRQVGLIHNNYFFLLLSTEDYKTADRYITRLIKRNPSNLYYQLDLGRIYRAQAKEGSADRYFKSIIARVVENTYLTRHAATYFLNNQLNSYALYTFSESRKALKNPRMYALELANLYRIENKRDLMVEEYLNYITTNPGNIRYVKNTLSNLLSETSELESLEGLLYDKIQKEPDNVVFPDLLVWVNLQLKNFYGAYLQARAIDRRLGNEGDRTMEIGQIALRNGDYVTASKIYNYIIDRYPRTANYIRAKMFLIEAYELRVKNSYPIKTEEIRKVVSDYSRLISELGVDRNTLEALRNKALLHAFYLDERDSAIQILTRIISTPRANPTVRSQSKLDLGDIYLLNGEPWESSLLYSQVEKEMKNTPVGYDAILKNAKLSYFRGDFLLSQEHLDIVKQATTREISNDAISLSVLIKDNIAMDSTEEAMRNYAAIELLLFQNKDEDALTAISEMKTSFDGHTLTDELLWLESEILLRSGKFQEAISSLEAIVETFGDDILADDAYFKMGDVYHNYLNDTEKASEIYVDFLKKYPGSVFAAEARKRFRQLRGDFDHLEEEETF